jgi:hypothetical protein
MGKKCQPPACNPNQGKCNGADLLVCNATRTDFVKVSTCATPALCSEAEGVCKSPSCAAGQATCMGTQLLVCNATRTGWDVKATCDAPELCDPAKEKCVSCVAGKYRCNPSNPQVLERCKSDQMGFETVKTCAPPSQCSATMGDCVGSSSDGGTTDARSD